MENPLEFIFASRSQFLNHYENNEPLVINDLKEKLEDIFELPFLNSLEELFRIWPMEVNSYLPGLADEINSTKVNVLEAKELYNEGNGLFFDGPHNMAPSILNWMEAIKKDLGLPTITFAQSIIYAISKGQGTDPHFDQNINFVIQISGEKKWWIAKNEHILNPTSRHTIGTPMNPELSSYADKEMPDEFPKNSKEYILKAGSVLFLPRGAWHKTQALEDSISLNFTYSPPTWLDVLTMAMRSELSKDSVWRETANYVSDPEKKDQVHKNFEKLIKQLSENKNLWNAGEILQSIESFN